jgi:hypothetical protein
LKNQLCDPAPVVNGLSGWIQMKLTFCKQTLIEKFPADFDGIFSSNPDGKFFIVIIIGFEIYQRINWTLPGFLSAGHSQTLYRVRLV